MTDSDVLIIGGGVAGLSCAIYTCKAGLTTTVIDEGSSQLEGVKTVWNFPGVVDGVSGEAWIAAARQQVQAFGGNLVREKVHTMTLAERPFALSVQPEGGAKELFTGRYLVLAVNLGYALLEEQGFTLGVNEHVPSRKIRFVEGVGYDGRTSRPGVFVAGLLANVPSQTVIAAGQGAFVGVQIASEALGRPFMWHD